MATINRNTATGMKLFWGDVCIATYDEPHPLAGMECELVKYMGMAKSGYDVYVTMPAGPVAVAYAAAACNQTSARPWGPDDFMEMFADQEMLKERGGETWIELEANAQDELMSVMEHDAAATLARAIYRNVDWVGDDDAACPHPVQYIIDAMGRAADDCTNNDVTRNLAGATGRALAALANAR